MRDLNEIQCFVRTIELKSLTAASKELGLPKSSISRKIKSLEERLGLTLLVRTTRALHLTDAGRVFFERSTLALKEIEHAELDLEGSRATVNGTLRITAPMMFLTGQFNNLLASFSEQYPDVKIDLHLTDRVIDLIAEGFDVAIRFGELEDSSLISKKLKPTEACIVGSPKYLKKYGEPKTIEELEKHELIVFTPNHSPLKWVLEGPSGKKTLTPKGRLKVNQLLSVKEAVLLGQGLALLPTHVIAGALQKKELKVLCSSWIAHGSPTHLVYPGQRFTPAKVRAFIDHATRSFLLEKP